MTGWIGRVLRGWYKFLFLPKSELSKKRLKICSSCTLRKGLFWWSYCSVCFCPLDMKSESEEEECPKGLWK